MPAEAGGTGEGFLYYACMNEEIGRAHWAQLVFGCQAPDAGNCEILHVFGTEEQKRRYLLPNVAGSVRSCFSMTEPEVSGADPTHLRTTAVVDGDEWQPLRPGERLGRRDADQERPHETGALGHGNLLDVVQRHVRRAESHAYDRRDELEVTSRRNLGDDAAETRMEIRLRRDDRREHAPVAGHHGGGSLVARRLQPEDHEARSDGGGSRHMMSASSRLSV